MRDGLEELARRGLLFCGAVAEEQTGYALQQVGYGFPQSFFWKGERTHHSEDMAARVVKYFRSPEIKETYGSKTKPFRYIPIKQADKTAARERYRARLGDELCHAGTRAGLGESPMVLVD